MAAEVPFKVGFRGTDLWQAVLKGDLKKVDKLLKSGADVTFMKDNKPMMNMVRELEMANQTSGDAAKLYYYRQIKGMLELKLNSAILTDVNTGDLTRVRALAKTGADLFQEGKVIFKAVGATKDNPEIVTLLLCNNQTNEQYIEMIQPDGKSHVSYILAEAQRTNNVNSAQAVKNHINFVVIRESEAGNLPRIQALMKLGRNVIDLNFKRADGHTALMAAVMRKRIEVVNVLLSNGADTTQVNAQKKTARHLCNNDVRLTAMLDKVGLVKELRENIRKNGASLKPEDIGSYLDKGVQVNSVDANGNSILSLAVQNKCSNEVLTDLVTTYHADPNILNKQGTGPVEVALVYRDAETLTCLFEAGVNIKRGKNMLLQYAEANGFAGSVQLIKEELGKLLWKAVDEENMAEIKEMLENCGAYVDETSTLEGYEGWTTLFLAAHKSNVEVAKLLCDSQANVDLKCEDEKTAISVAVQTGRKEVLLYLLAEGAGVNIADINGNTPLLLAVKAGYLPLVQILLHAGANPYHEQGGMSVAQVALESSNKNIVYLFEHLDFSTAIPDWEETTSDQRPAPKYSFFRPPINFNPNPPQKVQMVLQGNEKTNKKLLDAAKNGRPVQVKEAVAEGADIRFCDNKMKRPLQYAQEKLARLNQEVLSPLEEKKRQQLMLRNSYQDVVQFLTNKLNELIWNAVQRESLERVQTLHECGAELNWCRPEQPFGLPGLLASTQDNPDIMAYILHYCPNNLLTLRTTDQQKQTVLSLAEKNGFRKLTSWIRAKMTHSLHLAMANKDLTAAKQILSFGAGPELARSDGETHLHQAVEMGDLDLVKLLVKAGADSSVKFQGHLMGDLARMKGRVQMSRFLQQSLCTQKLFVAATSGELSAVQGRHLQGGHIDCQSFQGITPLKVAVSSGNAKLMHYLISRGASLVRSKTSSDPIGQLESLNYNLPLYVYIQSAVDEQFLATVVEGDMTKLEYLLQLGANITYCNPDSKETAISLCINYHSTELLKFLEKRGSILTTPADAKGNYALGIAAGRGNTDVVAYLIHEININKTIRNNEGKTPLDIAQEADHQEVVRLLGGEVKEDKGKKSYKPPNYKLEELLMAVKNCNMTIIKEFIDEIYSKRNEKVHHCVEMWKVSQRENQKEVEKKLAQHYQDLIEDTSEHKLTGSAESQVILTGFLRSLSAQITGCALDPNDPRSYDIFFKNMDEKAEEARKRILIDDMNQLKAQFQEDLARVQEELAGLKQQRESMHARDREYFERIAQMKVQLSEEQSARERDRIRQEMITLQDDVKTLHAQQKILEAQEKRQNKHCEASKRFEATHINLLHFYRTIYLGVEEIFIGAKSVASGMTVATAGSLGKKAAKLQLASGILDIFKLDPLIGATVARVNKFFIKTGVAVMKNVDKYRQKEIGQYISCLATIGEQVDICTDVAYRLTLWYSGQIQCLAEPSDSSKTSICLHAPARRMAQLAVGIIYSSLMDKRIEK
ncbi:ankyrin repeat, partial [Paramuricea clavata]